MKFLRGTVSDESSGGHNIAVFNDADGFISSGDFIFLHMMPSLGIVLNTSVNSLSIAKTLVLNNRIPAMD